MFCPYLRIMMNTCLFPLKVPGIKQSPIPSFGKVNPHFMMLQKGNTQRNHMVSDQRRRKRIFGHVKHIEKHFLLGRDYILECFALMEDHINYMDKIPNKQHYKKIAKSNL